MLDCCQVVETTVCSPVVPATLPPRLLQAFELWTKPKHEGEDGSVADAEVVTHGRPGELSTQEGRRG